MSRITPSPIERLEGRTLLAAAVVHGGMLRVAGDGRADSVITVANAADPTRITVTVDWVHPRTQQPQNLTRSFPKADVRVIHVRGGAGRDTITVGPATDTAGAAIPATVMAKAGDDFITLSDGADFVNAGPGSDTVAGGGGNDILVGGVGFDNLDGNAGDDILRGHVGNDVLSAGAGNDRIHGHLGDDFIDAGAGNDVVRAEQGNDTVEAGPDDDTVFGGIGNDLLRGGGGNDTLWGGAGDDTVEGGQGNDTLGGVIGANILLGGDGADTFNVRDLALNTSHDFNAADGDILNTVATRREGPKPPAI